MNNFFSFGTPYRRWQSDDSLFDPFSVVKTYYNQNIKLVYVSYIIFIDLPSNNVACFTTESFVLLINNNNMISSYWFA